MKPVRILLADDHEVVRRGLRSILESESGYEVAGEAKDGREAVAKAKELNPDVVVMDISMPNLNGLEATRSILKHTPNARVIVLTMYSSEQVIREVLEAGARGFLLKSDAGRDLLLAIEALMKHRTFFSPGVADIVLEGYLGAKQGNHKTLAATQENLTAREREILQLLAEGKATKEVASMLGISVRTAETHRAHIMHKLRLESFSELVRYAVRNKIIEA